MSISDPRSTEGQVPSALSAETFEIAAGARRNRLIALWAAEKMGLSEASAENYARAVEDSYVVEDDVIRKIAGDLLASNIAVRDAEVRTRAAEFLAQAREHFKTS